MPKLRPPQQVVDIAARLEARGFEAWCVGGAIRDALLGHRHLDWDLATSARPEQVREIFGHRRTIPVGIEFGTVGVLDATGVMHEVTTFRRDVRTDGRHAEVEFGVSLDDDLARRDFTINAMAYSPAREELRDPYGGREDLQRGVIRAVGDAQARMREDRLRALRGIRFAARFGFALDADTLAAIRESAPHLGRLSAERVKQEIEKTMDQVPQPADAFGLWKSTGAFATLVPELARAPDAALTVPNYLAMPGLGRRPQRRLTRLAGLFAGLDARTVAKVLTDLRFSKQDTSWISTVVGRWQQIGDDIAGALVAGGARQVAEGSKRVAEGSERVAEESKRVADSAKQVAGGVEQVSDATVRGWVATIGRLHVGAVMRLATAAWHVRRLAGKPYPDARSAACLYRRMLKVAFRDPIELRDLAVDGNDLKQAGVAGGRELGRILQALLQRVLEDPALNRTDWLLQEGLRLYREGTAAEGGEVAAGVPRVASEKVPAPGSTSASASASGDDSGPNAGGKTEQRD